MNTKIINKVNIRNILLFIVSLLAVQAVNKEKRGERASNFVRDKKILDGKPRILIYLSTQNDQKTRMHCFIHYLYDLFFLGNSLSQSFLVVVIYLLNGKMVSWFFFTILRKAFSSQWYRGNLFCSDFVSYRQN